MIEMVPMKYFTMPLRVTNYTKSFENYSLVWTMYRRRNAATSDFSSGHSSIIQNVNQLENVVVLTSQEEEIIEEVFQNCINLCKVSR